MGKWFVILAILICTGCSHSIKRFGYNKGESLMPEDTCQISFFKFMPTDTSVFRQIGRIKLGDTGFSLLCNENDAIQILKREACLIGADAVNIVYETRSDFWSTCYRAEAEFLKTSSELERQENEVIIGNVSSRDFEYDTGESAVMARVKIDSERNVVMIISACGAGLLACFLLTLQQ